MRFDAVNDAPGELDTKALNRFSRQNAALGAETTAKLIKMRVLIVGLRGVGIEAAKNLALQGAGAITVHDNKPTQMQDLGVNFFLNEGDVSKGTPRAAACAPRIQELNPLCTVSEATELGDEVILQHSAVVITEPTAVAELVRLNEFCRANGVAFFFAFTGGVHMSIFADLGPTHVVNDFNGERPVQKLITGVTAAGAGECLIRYDTPEGQQPIALSTGHFEVSEVVGVDGINGKVFPVTHPYSDPVKVRVVCYGSTCLDHPHEQYLTSPHTHTRNAMSPDGPHPAGHLHVHGGVHVRRAADREEAAHALPHGVARSQDEGARREVALPGRQADRLPDRQLASQADRQPASQTAS